MNIPRWTLRAVALLATLVGSATSLAAQGVTTGAITGTVTDPRGGPVEGAQVQVVNTTTGYTASARTRASGLYLVQGLESGGPYTVKIRRIGFEPSERPGIFVSLSQATRVDVQLATQAVTLSEIRVTVGAMTPEISPTKQGISTQISDTLLTRVPILTRSFTDLVKLTPQVSRSCKENSGGSYTCGTSPSTARTRTTASASAARVDCRATRAAAASSRRKPCVSSACCFRPPTFASRTSPACS
jgi:hypothetical protein